MGSNDATYPPKAGGSNPTTQDMSAILQSEKIAVSRMISG